MQSRYWKSQRRDAGQGIRCVLRTAIEPGANMSFTAQENKHGKQDPRDPGVDDLRAATEVVALSLAELLGPAER